MSQEINRQAILELFNRIVLVIPDSAGDTIFSDGAQLISDKDLEQFQLQHQSLNVEGLMVFRKTVLATLIERYLDNCGRNLYAMPFIGILLLMVADPSFLVSAKRLRLLPDRAFTDIEPFFHTDSFSRKYLVLEELDKAGIKQNELLQLMVKDDLLQEENGRYYINDEYILKGIKAGFCS